MLSSRQNILLLFLGSFLPTCYILITKTRTPREQDAIMGKEKAMYPPVPKQMLYKEPTGIVLGKYKGKYVCRDINADGHVFLIGGSGSGKSSCYVIPSLLVNSTARIFAVDIKGELSYKSARCADEHVLIFNPQDRSKYGYNPFFNLDEKSSSQKILEVMQTIVYSLIPMPAGLKDPFWKNSARNLFLGLLIYYYKCGVADFVSIIDADYLKTMSKLHNYSFNNSLLIAMQKPNATMVAGYTSWKVNFHRNVMKGEKGIRILAPSPYKISKDVEKIDPKTKQPMIGKDGEPIRERIQVTIPAYRVTTVFDVSQTQGKPIPEIATVLTDDVKDYKYFLNAIKEISPVPIEMREINSGANGYYHLEDKIIAIKEGMSQAQTLKTAIHELSHAKLHDKDVGLEKDKQLDKRTKEVQAESVAYTVCCHYGLDTSDYSFGYIAEWSSNKELDELKKSMDIIRSTASEIIKDIDITLIRIEQEERIENLALEIGEFIKDYDYYEYMDVVDDAEKLIEDIKADIQSGNIEYLQKWFISIGEEKGAVDMCEQAREIAEQLNDYLKEEPVSRTKAVETKDVVKHRHRSH